MKRNLLLVDDEIDLSLNMKELLEDEASQIFIAQNGLEGLEILAKENIHCVVSDIRMPVMDGLSMLAKAKEGGHQVPFIFYTGHGSHELRKTACELGAFDLFTKPNFGKLELAIKSIMKR